MKIAFVADLHLANHRRYGGEMKAGVNWRAEAVLGVLDQAVTRAVAQACDMLVVLGDLFDTTRPEPQLIARVQTIFQRATDENMDVVVMVGNHDQVSSHAGDHALGPLEPVARIVDKTTLLQVGGVELVLIPFITGAASGWIPKELDGILGKPGEQGARSVPPSTTRRLLALHCGLADDRTPPWLVNAPDSIPIDRLDSICEHSGIDFVFAGNWHSRQVWERTPGDASQHARCIMQVGALVPTGFDNPGLTGYGTVATWDCGVVSAHELPGPRFVKVQSKVELADVLKQNASLKHDLFISESAAPEDLRERAVALNALVTGKVLQGAQVLPDLAVAQAEARTAATSAKSAETMQAALDAFVRDMPLDDGVDRAAVLARARGYIE